MRRIIPCRSFSTGSRFGSLSVRQRRVAQYLHYPMAIDLEPSVDPVTDQSFLGNPKSLTPLTLTIYSFGLTGDPDELNTLSINRVTQGLTFDTD